MAQNNLTLPQIFLFLFFPAERTGADENSGAKIKHYATSKKW